MVTPWLQAVKLGHLLSDTMRSRVYSWRMHYHATWRKIKLE